ncbi:MAG: hypothetical protein ACLSH8_16910 [Zhenhengia sp.]|uniref:hypothetical protein n=1 Tax=Zhenhengia sp. TaxID=2944208 RepID=UPI003991DA60
MNWKFYGVWLTISFFVAFYVVFTCGWEDEKIKYHWIKQEDYVPRVYYWSIVKNTIQRIFIFAMCSILYMACVFAIHFSFYGIQNIETIEEYITRSISYVILLFILGNEIGSINKLMQDDNIDIIKVDFLKKIIIKTRMFCFKRVIKHEKKTYNKFLSNQINKISKNEDLKNLFILKCQSNSWSRTLGISIDTYQENIANRLWDAFEQDIRFNEVVEEIFTKEFDKFDANIVDIIKLFNNCRKSNIKGKELKIKEKIDELKRKSIQKEFETYNNRSLKTVDINEYIDLRDDCV